MERESGGNAKKGKMEGKEGEKVEEWGKGGEYRGEGENVVRKK